jgi:hypothetical protein
MDAVEVDHRAEYQPEPQTQAAAAVQVVKAAQVVTMPVLE